MQNIVLEQISLILADGKGFGINTNIFETNLINQSIILVGVIFLGRKSLIELLTERKSEIIRTIKESEERLNTAQLRFNEARKQLLQSQVIITQLREDAQSTKLSFLETDSKFIKTEITKRFNSTKSILKFKEKQILKEIEQEITTKAFK